MNKPLLVITLFAATPVAAHDWYPMECCSGMDCAPALNVEQKGLPAVADFAYPGTAQRTISGLTITTKHGTVLVPPNFPRRESKDH